MLPDDFFSSWWFKTAAYALFASFGGIMGHLLRVIHDEKKVRWSRAALEGGAAGFVGLLVLLLCQAMGLSEQWTGVIVGVSGWLGANATIQMLEGVIRKKLGLENKPEPPA